MIRTLSLAAALVLAPTLPAAAQHAMPGMSDMQMDAPAQTAGEVVHYDAPDAFVTQLGGVYTAYLAIHTALSSDDLTAAKSGAVSLTAALSGVDMMLLSGDAHLAWMADLGMLTKSADALAAAGDIASARTGFDTLSAALIRTARQFGAPDPLYVLHCPMAFDNRGADWLQASPSTENPYFGSSMYTCGAVTDSLAVK